MAINFLQAKKRQKNLILILTLVIIATLVIVWQGFLRRGAPAPLYSAPPALPAIDINWSALENPQITDLQVFEEILPFEGETGRENPFIPY